MNTLVVLGSVNADHVLRVSQLPKPGETVSGTDFQILYGGKGANQAVAACQMGANTAFVGCLGEDAIGSEMIARFAELGMETSGLQQIEGSKTGSALIFVDPAGENCIGISAQANSELTADRIQPNRKAIESARTLLMQLETPLEGIEYSARIAKEAATMVVLNPAPAQPLPDRLLSLIDIITPNQTEAEILTGVAVPDSGSDWDNSSAARAADVLHDKGVPTVLITLGSRGVWFSEQGQGKLISGFKVKAVDTTAAGDCFNGALVAGLQDGQPMLDAIEFAQAAAAISVTREGAQASIPCLDEVRSFLVAKAS
ncbi:ribokinase [Motiliproteus sp. MSK22-1]|uniref:ribokinase n=1 Tax=Motiliproteus sp. MSK22-1 TaxID=1897630 RepID=UPI000976D797|nr:ribokinase [Motiliproteus sp. MSK22-1]OMH37978.1 ribokinase [Motiliproteus sp. MSK22-1]